MLTSVSFQRQEDFTGIAAIRSVNFDTTEEGTSRLSDTQQEENNGSTSRSIDTILDTGEDGDDDRGEPDEEFEWVDTPKVVYLMRRSDEIGHGVDDDGGETGGRDVEECIGETVEGDDDDDSGEPTSCGSSDTALGFESGSGEGTSGGHGTEDGSDGVGDTNS
jgi:hypothetical protein